MSNDIFSPWYKPPKKKVKHSEAYYEKKLSKYKTPRTQCATCGKTLIYGRDKYYWEGHCVRCMNIYH